MTARCPSDLALETYLLEPERSPHARHVHACATCRGRVARMREEGEDFRRYVFPATVEKVEQAAGSRRRFSLAFIVGPVAAVGALAAALLLFVKTQQGGPAPDYVGLKGSGLGLAVYVNTAAGAQAVEDGAAVPASAALRFKVAPAGECWLWIMSVDAKGQVSRLYPPNGVPPQATAAGPVPGGAALDGTAGPERIFAVCAPSAMAWNDVKATAQPYAASAEAVRGARVLGGALASAAQSTVLLEKRP